MASPISRKLKSENLKNYEKVRSLAADGMTMMVVTHEMRFARQVADYVLFLDDGQIVEAGPPDELFDHPQQKRTQDFLNKVL